MSAYSDTIRLARSRRNDGQSPNHLCLSTVRPQGREVAGPMSKLQELDIYTSYGLHYLPIEVLACTQLNDSRFSTRALYYNYKGAIL